VDVRECDECRNVVPIHDQVCSRCGCDLDYVEPRGDLEPAQGSRQATGG
jgi:hypothetical protein